MGQIVAQEARERERRRGGEGVEINVHKYYARSMNDGTFKWYKLIAHKNEKKKKTEQSGKISIPPLRHTPLLWRAIISCMTVFIAAPHGSKNI